MIAPNTLATIRRQIAEGIDLSELDDGRIGISLPITYDDGDHCACYAVRGTGGWELRDYGDILTRASYRDVNLLSRGYAGRVKKIAEFYGASATGDGELMIPVHNGDFGQAVFTFAQTCLAMQSLAKTRPEKEPSQTVRFHDEVAQFLASKLPSVAVTPHWHDPTLDPEGVYGVDCHIATRDIPWFVFAPTTSQHCLKAAVTIQHFKLGSVGFRSLAVLRNESELPSPSRIPLRDVTDVWLPDYNDGAPLEQVIADEIRPQLN